MGKKLRSTATEMAKGLGEFALGGATAVIAFMLANFGCMMLVAMFILSVVVTILVAKSKKYSPKGKIVIIVFAILTLMSYGMYHKNNCHNVAAAPAIEAETTPVDETEDEVKEEVAVVEEDVEEEKFVRDYLDATERKECIDIQVTKESSKNIENGVAKTEGTTTVSIGEVTTNNDDDKIIEEMKKDETKEVTEMAEGITAVTEKVTDEEESKVQPQVEEPKKEETTKVEIPEEVEEVVSEEAKATEVITEEKIEANTEIEETEKEEDFADMSSEELEALFVETTTETVTVVETVVEVEDVVEEVEVEIETPVIDVENVEEQEIIEDEVIVEDIVEIEEEATEEVKVEVEDIVEEPVVEPVVEEVAVTAIDGYTTVVGSQIQFQVSGDDVVIEGLDGINYTFSNGILTIDAGSEATVISVCVSNSVNAVDFNITVNGIIG